MNNWLLSFIHVASATTVLYVLPDNVSDVNCPSQPCATLGQYLLDNGSLPVLSNVEYHFLPGEHHIVNAIDIEEAFNFSLIGFSLSHTKLVCKSHFYVGVFFSYNVTIRNLVLSECSGILGSQFAINIAASLYIYQCSHCIIENIYLLGYGFAGVNLFQNSYLNNITIDITKVNPAVNKCSLKFLLKFVNMNDSHDYVFINQVSISGYFELFLTERYQLMKIQIDKSYGLHIEFSNLKFYNITERAISIEIKHSNTSILFKNCTFMYIINKIKMIPNVIFCEIPIQNTIIKFENIAFHYNIVNSYLLLITFGLTESFCIHPSNVTIENCNFVGNDGKLILLSGDNYCKANIFFNGVINLIKNTVNILIDIQYMVVIINGTVTISENIVKEHVTRFSSCELTCVKTIAFLSNICDHGTIITVHSDVKPYIKIMEYANITLVNNTYHHLLDSGPVINNVVYPYCIFQYMALANNKNISELLLPFYSIELSGNKQCMPDSIHIKNVNNLLAHCGWLHNALFKEYDPGYVNQKIVQIDGHHWIQYKQICYCPHDGNYDCTVDLLGPVYPGQKLQIELCFPQAESNDSYILHTKTHDASLPNSACKVARQAEFINSIKYYSETFNFTIISESELCELFLTIQPFVQTVFFVQLLPCPVGFTLQNGKCQCDPLLPPDIDTCYIDLSAIRRPANTWVTARTVANNATNYLISDCPMDYCLPYSTNVNLLYPDLQCQFNRTAMLCSQCQNPLSMVFGSSRCMKCTNVHILITIIVLVAGIVLVVLLYVLNLTVTNGTINGIIFYANIISINDSVFLVNDNLFKPLRVFISFINLDLGIETCFYNGMDSYAKMWLQLFFPSYLILIAVSIIIASRYSSRMLRLTYNRSLPVLVTLFLLSYTGVLRVVLTVLFSYSTITHYPSGSRQIVWSIDASVPLFQFKFTIIFITCLALFLILIAFNITLIFTRHLSRFRIVNNFKPLLDALQGSYKDKYYYWVALNMLLRSSFFALYAFQIKVRLILANIILVIFTSYYGYLQPNKNKIVNFQELLILVNLTIMYSVSIQEDEKIFSIIINAMMSLAIVQFGITVLGHFFLYTFHCNFSIKERFELFFNKRKPNQPSFEVALLDIPECTYNYTEYQDGLVSDDFKNCK